MVSELPFRTCASPGSTAPSGGQEFQRAYQMLAILCGTNHQYTASPYNKLWQARRVADGSVAVRSERKSLHTTRARPPEVLRSLRFLAKLDFGSTISAGCRPGVVRERRCARAMLEPGTLDDWPGTDSHLTRCGEFRC